MGTRFVGNQEDLRVVKTDRRIREAALDLMRENLGAVPSVKAVIARAEINKSTFYYHYESVQQLVEAIEEDLLADAVRQACAEGCSMLRDVEGFLNGFAEFAYGPMRVVADANPRLKPEMLEKVMGLAVGGEPANQGEPAAGDCFAASWDPRVAEMVLLGVWGLTRRMDREAFVAAIPALTRFLERGLRVSG